MKELVFITGINGAGKTLLANSVADLLGFCCVTSSGLLKEACGVKHSYELERFDQEHLKKVYVEALMNLAQVETRPIILDTHSVIFMGDGKEDYGQPVRVFPYTKGIIDVVSSPAIIAKRIEDDNSNGSKYRACIPSLSSIEDQLTKSTNAAKRISLDGGFPYQCFVNDLPLSADRINALGEIINRFLI